jgi:hypothetical protein
MVLAKDLTLLVCIRLPRDVVNHKLKALDAGTRDVLP